MEDWREEIWERANLFAAKNGRSLIGQLGYGYDGNVFATERQSAIKVLRFQRLYERERDVYLRLQSRSIVEVAGFSVPQLIHHDDHLMGRRNGYRLSSLCAGLCRRLPRPTA